MFVKKRNYDNCIQKVRINVGTLVGLDSDEEAYIVMKELPTFEMLGLRNFQQEGEEGLLHYIKDILPSIIVDHNFYEDENKKMSNEDLAKLIFERVDLSTKVINDYINASFFTRKRVTDNN